MSALIGAPSALGLNYASYPIAAALLRHENQIGNPDSVPIIFKLKSTRLSDIDTEGEIAPWLLMHHDPSVSEVNLKGKCRGRAGQSCWSTPPEDYLDPGNLPRVLGPEVNAENGIVAIAVVDSMKLIWRLVKNRKIFPPVIEKLG